MDLSLGDGAAIAALVLVVVAVSAPIVWFVRRTFQAHDPARARAMAEVSPDGSFELASSEGGALWFRFEIDGGTDADYDLVVRGEVERADGGSEPFAWRTSDKSAVEGAAETRRVVTTHAVTTRRGSFELATLPSSRCVVHGRVDGAVANALKRAWVYVRDVA